MLSVNVLGVWFMLVFISPSSPWPGTAPARPGTDVQPGWAGQGPVLGRKDPFGTSAVYPLPVIITFVSI